MKTLEKAEMLERNKVMRVLTEARILAAVDHPFLASLYGTIVTDTHLHFLMQARARAHAPPRTPCAQSSVPVPMRLLETTVVLESPPVQSKAMTLKVLEALLGFRVYLGVFCVYP